MFKLRTRTFEYKSMYKNLNKSDLNCSLCSKSEDNQDHLFYCEDITEGNDTEIVQYLDIFHSYPKQEKSIKVFLNLSRKP